MKARKKKKILLLMEVAHITRQLQMSIALQNIVELSQFACCFSLETPISASNFFIIPPEISNLTEKTALKRRMFAEKGSSKSYDFLQLPLYFSFVFVVSFLYGVLSFSQCILSSVDLFFSFRLFYLIFIVIVIVFCYIFKGVSVVDVSINWKDHYSTSKLVDVCLEGFISYEEFKVDHFAELFFKIIEFFNFNSTNLSVVVIL